MIKILLVAPLLFLLTSCSFMKESFLEFTKKNSVEFDPTLIKNIVPTGEGKAYVQCINGLWYADKDSLVKVEEEEVLMEEGVTSTGNKFRRWEKRSKLSKLNDELITMLLKRSDVPSDIKEKVKSLKSGNKNPKDDPLGLFK